MAEYKKLESEYKAAGGKVTTPSVAGSDVDHQAAPVAKPKVKVRRADALVEAPLIRSRRRRRPRSRRPSLSLSPPSPYVQRVYRR
jgi:hypothetical protein